MEVLEFPCGCAAASAPPRSAVSLTLPIRAVLVLIAATFADVEPRAEDREPAPAAATQALELQRVTVTGSNIPRVDLETPSPMQVITAKDLQQSGYTTVHEVLQDITANGQGTLSQSFAFGAASGASGIALRGLTVGATLVLIDGHRMASFPVGDDGIRSFVDIANLPFNVIERIEVLKDGASAVYGSDAIAGVVNIILKRSFVGTSLSADVGTSYKNDGTSQYAAAIFGVGDLGSDGYNVYVAGEWRKQSQIRLVDRGGIYTRTDYTADGGYDLTRGVPAPGNPFVGPFPASTTGYVIGRGGIAGFMPGCDAARLTARECTFANEWSQIQPATENDNFVTRYTQNLGQTWQLALQASYFRSRVQSVTTPSTTFPQGFDSFTSGPDVVPTLLPTLPPTTIPATNPSFPPGTGLTSGPLRYTFVDLGGRITEANSQATRLIADVHGRLGPWDAAAALGHTEVRLQRTGLNHVQPSSLQSALDSATDPYLVGGPNSASVLELIAPPLRTNDLSTLDFMNVTASRDLFALSGGPLSLAVGVDYMRRRINTRAPDAVAAGSVVDFDNGYAVGQQKVASAHAELVAPLTQAFNAEAAVRYDHYDQFGGKASPKLGLKYRLIPELAIRGTASRGFRAPGIAESGNSGSTSGAGSLPNDPVLCPSPANPNAPGSFPSQCNLTFALVASGNPELKPETSKAYTLGVLVEPTPSLSSTLDFYSITIDNQIVGGTVQTPVRGSNFTPIPQVQADGSIALVVPPVAPFAYAKVPFINANSTRTSGFDLGVRYRHRFEGVGTIESNLTVTYIAQYDITIGGVTYHLAGTHGPFVVSGDTGNPRARVQWVNTFSRGPWQVSGTLNYISSFGVIDPSAGQLTCIDALLASGAGSLAFQGVLASGTVPAAMSCKVGSFTTFDLYGRYDFSKRLSVHGSVLNVFNAAAPPDWTTYGGDGGRVPWNPSFHRQGAIGRYFSIGANYTF